MILLWRHLLESTLVCAFLSCLALSLPSGARRHAVWFGVTVKFATPTVLLSVFGSRLAAEWPPTAASFVHWLAKRFNAALQSLGWSSPSITFQNRYALAAVTIWIIGFVIALVLWRRAWNATAVRTEGPPQHLQEAFAEICTRLKVRDVELRICPQRNAVTLRGITRPVLLLPAALATHLSAKELEAVFTHELAHARRCDNLTGVIARAITCLFWFHPLLWVAENQQRRERECACDDEVIACGVDCNVYLRALSKACLPVESSFAGVSAMARTDLQVRLARLRSGRKMLFVRSVPPVLLSGLLLVMTIFPVASGYCEECVSHADSNITGFARR